LEEGAHWIVFFLPSLYVWAKRNELRPAAKMLTIAFPVSGILLHFGMVKQKMNANVTITKKNLR